MSKPENFLQRWSKRKLAERERSLAEQTATQPAPIDVAASPPGPSEKGQTANTSTESFDLASLPSLDSIAATTDVTAFLRPGVPPDLTRAALRRAWSSDPAIRDFVGLVENGWDFNDPSAMAGFGAISAEEVAQLASKLIGELPKLDSAATAANTVVEEQSPESSPAPCLEAAKLEVSDAPDPESDEEVDDAPQQSGGS
jgi:hypothetical protein